MNKKILIKTGEFKDKICVIKRTYNQRDTTKIIGHCFVYQKTVMVVVNKNNFKSIELN
ncbi:50S ribosomal protein L24 [Candidatus Hodgkinia cicadicola]|uniref:50S ribosomal protein L24 n=1 Tax=Candidatus Hodgkinia cicadicola TaxID=573658 RepID=A0ABX4MEZ8_9HYPH|nr:50S ribosomal protein L24 [Candidatus Hodgkinia cicadicola]